MQIYMCGKAQAPYNQELKQAQNKLKGRIAEEDCTNFFMRNKKIPDSCSNFGHTAMKD